MTRVMPQYEWVSVHEAGRRLNKSVSTIRRMIEAGDLVGEREPMRGARDRYRVRFDAPDASQPPEDAPGSESPEASEAPDDAPEAPTALTAALETITSLVERNAVLSDRVAALEREAGELGGSVDAYRREVAWLKAELERARRPWWRFW
jgi:hypothetical protein